MARDRDCSEPSADYFRATACATQTPVSCVYIGAQNRPKTQILSTYDTV
jgi:hypothetical protein